MFGKFIFDCYRIACIALLLSFLSACAPSQPPSIAFFTLTPFDELTPTTRPTAHKPSWEINATLPPRTPLPPGTAEPTLILSATETFTATPLPPPQLETYLPGLTDLNMCSTLSYNIGTNTAALNCGLQTYGSISMAIYPSKQPYKEDALLLPANYIKVDFPTIGAASSAGANDTGDVLLVQFYKKNVKVVINYSTPKAPVKVSDAEAVVRILEQKIPDSIETPSELTFIDTPQLENVSKYLLDVKFFIYSKGTFFSEPNFPRNAQVCVYVAPIRTERDKMWTVVLYNQQTEKIERKMMYSLFANRVCGGLEPSYTPQNPFKEGDRYEVRVGTNGEWVATFPFVTK